MNDAEAGSGVITVSLGATRVYRLKKDADQTVQSLDVEGGSVLMLSATTNARYKHAIMKTSRQVGERISLTFRAVKAKTVVQEPVTAQTTAVQAPAAQAVAALVPSPTRSEVEDDEANMADIYAQINAQDEASEREREEDEERCRRHCDKTGWRRKRLGKWKNGRSQNGSTDDPQCDL